MSQIKLLSVSFLTTDNHRLKYYTLNFEHPPKRCLSTYLVTCKSSKGKWITQDCITTFIEQVPLTAQRSSSCWNEWSLLVWNWGSFRFTKQTVWKSTKGFMKCC